MGGQVLVRGGHRCSTFSLSATAASYTTGKVIGVPTEIANAMQDTGGTGILESLCLLDKEKQNGAIDLYFFDSLPTSQGADTATFALSAAESIKLLGKVSVGASDYSSSSIVGEATKTALALSLASKPQAVAKTKSIWVLAVARASITFSGADKLFLRLGILQD